MAFRLMDNLWKTMSDMWKTYQQLVESLGITCGNIFT